MSKTSGPFWKWLIGIAALVVIGWLTWQIGLSLDWSWADFWSNLISNAASSAVIGFILYWIITRPDEKKARQERKNQALAILKIEFGKNLERARVYGFALKKLRMIYRISIPCDLQEEHGMRSRKVDFFLNWMM